MRGKIITSYNRNIKEMRVISRIYRTLCRSIRGNSKGGHYD